MEKPPPTIYLFHGEDEFGIATEIARLKAKMGEVSSVEMDYTVLEPGTYSLEDLRGIVLTIPFLTSRRLVVLHDPLKQFSKGEDRASFQALLEGVPEKTALVIAERADLGEKHWLLKWSQGKRDQVYVRGFPSQSGGSMAAWIRQEVGAQGGDITREAADSLAELVGTQKRAAAQEIDKLLAYAGYQRAVEVEDVRLLSTGIDEEAVSKVFELVDILGQRRPQEATDRLHQLQQVYDPAYLFIMIVRHFRFLIIAREVFDTGLSGADLAQRLKIQPWLANKLLPQARNFEIEALEDIYRQLLAIDRGVKTSQTSYSLGLDTLVAGFIPHPAGR